MQRRPSPRPRACGDGSRAAGSSRSPGCAPRAWMRVMQSQGLQCGVQLESGPGCTRGEGVACVHVMTARVEECGGGRRGCFCCGMPPTQSWLICVVQCRPVLQFRDPAWWGRGRLCARHKSVSCLQGGGMEWWGWARRCDVLFDAWTPCCTALTACLGAVHVCLQCHCICHILHVKRPAFYCRPLAFLQRCSAPNSLSEPCETSIWLPAADLRSMKACGRRSASNTTA